MKIEIIKFLKIQKELGLVDLISRLDQDFEKRLLIQKIFYFLTKFDFNFSLKYNFYKYGPYSPDLADIYYYSLEMKMNENESVFSYQFSEEEKIILHKVKKIINDWGIDMRKWEYYSSLLYIHEDMYFKNWNINSVESKLARDKPKLFDIFKFKQVHQELKNLGLIKNY